MFNFFKRKARPIKDFSFIHTDMHAHWIPGVDDGAKTVEDALELIRGLAGLGYRKLIATPHVMGEYYPNTPEQLRAGFEQIEQVVSEAGISVQLELAAEYYLDDFFKRLLDDASELLSFSGGHVLVEFSTFSEPGHGAELLFELQTRNYQPILAHPERYLYFRQRFDQFEQLKSRGCTFQVNLLSLTGYYGRPQKKLALQMLEAGMVDYLGTDLHKKTQLDWLLKISDRRILELIQTQTFKNAAL